MARYKRKKDGTFVQIDDEPTWDMNDDGTFTKRNSTTTNDIAPVKTEAKKEEKNFQFFQKGSTDQGVIGYANAALATPLDLLLDVGKGLGRMVEGVGDLGGYATAAVADWLGADKYAEDVRAEARKSYVDKLTKGADDWLDQYSVLGRTSDAIGEGIGQVAGIILTGGLGSAAGLGTLGTTALTTGTTFMSSTGNNIGEAYEGGATDGKAFAYGVSTGAIEAGTELLFGGLGKGVKALGISKGISSLDDVFAKKISSKISNQFFSNLAEFGVKSSAEGVEEVLSGIGSATMKKLTYMNDAELSQLLEDENLLEQFVVGTVTSGLAQSGYMPYMTKGSLREANATGRDFVTGLTQSEQAVIDKAYEKAVSAAEQNGEKLTKREKTQLYDNIIEKMDKGDIDIDTIEEVLGGDDYKAYKDIAEFTDGLSKRADELGSKTQPTLAEQYEYSNLIKRMGENNTKKSEARAKLDETMSGLMKGSRLVESYNEKARKGQAFEADLSKYTGKQREAVERAIKSGVLNNTNKSHALVDTLSKIEAEKGIVFDYADNAKLKESGFALEGKTVNGFVKNGAVTLNVQSSKAWQSTVGHEISHVLEGTEAYTDLRNALFKYAESKGELESRRTALTELYNGMDADIDAELTADLVGDYLFSDSNFIKGLTTNKNLFQKIYDEIKYLCKVATGKELTEIEKVRREFDKAWKELSLNESLENEATDSEVDDVQYSVSVKDKKTLDTLNEQVAKGEYNAETNPDGGYYVTYKSMSYWGTDENGNAILRSPMAEYVDGELSNAYLIPKDKNKLNWYQATETIDENTGLPSGLMVKTKKDGNKSFTYLPASENQDLIAEDWSNLYFNLQKKVLKNGKWVKSDVPARYNPYEHSSNSMLNDQFSAAYLRDNLVTVKMYVPVSEDNGAFRAQYSKDPTGWADWKTGTVAGKINKQKDLQRKVYLSRYAAPVEIVPDSEVARAYKEYLDGTDVTIPDNVVSPNLLKELKKAGVPITESGKVKYSVSEDSNGNELSLAVQKRFANSKAVDENGKLKVLYHGTYNGEFYTFDKSKGSVEGDFGSGFYFTDNETDVENNYEGGGADFENKVARRAEQIEAEEEIDYSEAEARAREELYKGSNKHTVYLNIENPAIVGETYLFDYDSYAKNYDRNDYDSDEDYEGDVEQLISDDIDQIIWDIDRNIDLYSTDGIAEVLWNAVNEGGIDVEQLKANINNLYLEDSDGNFAGNEVTRQIIESLGYDGIIDNTVSSKFNMGLDEGTTHYIVFKPNQIKSIDNQNPTDDPDIRFSVSEESLENIGNILYNNNNPLAIVNRANSDNNSSIKWVYKAKIFSVIENKLFHEKISEINQGSQAFQKNSIDEYMLPIENKIVFTNGNYESPYIREIVEVLTDSQTEFEAIKERIFDVEKGKSSKQDAVRYVQNVYGKGCVITYASGNDGVYGWEDGRRKGKTRRTVIRDYLNKHYGRGNDNQINETKADLNGSAFLNADSQLSLSKQGEQFAPVGNYSTPLNEAALAPTQEDIFAMEGESVAEENATFDAPMPTESNTVSVGEVITSFENNDGEYQGYKINVTHLDTQYDKATFTLTKPNGEVIKDSCNANPAGGYNDVYDYVARKYIAKEMGVAESVGEAPMPTDADAPFLNEIAPMTEETSEGLESSPKKDTLEARYERINKQLELYKVALEEDFAKRKEEMEKSLADHPAYIRNKALGLYKELQGMRKGVRVSKELGYLLDNLDLSEENKAESYRSLRKALLNIKTFPNKLPNNIAEIETIAREMLETAYDDDVATLINMDSQYQVEVERLEKSAEEQRKNARKEIERGTRKELHEKIVEDIKATFSSGGFDFDDVLAKAKDLSTFSTVDNTPQRVMEKALGYKEGQALADLTVNKVAQNETEGIKWLNTFTDRKSGLLAQLSKQYNIKPASKESAAAQMYAEGFYVDKNNDIVAYGDAELAQDFPDANVRNNIKGLANDARIRQIYDETLNAINESRTRNAYPEIQRLDNYFLHFRAMDDTFSRMGLPFNPNDIKAKDLPTDLNGVTADLKPGQPYFASAMHRKGRRTSFDLLGGLERYLTSAKNQIYHIDDIQTLRALRNYIADNYGQANGLEGLDALNEEEQQERIEQVFGSHLSTFAKFLNEEANVIAGKTALIDRGLEGIIGRRGMTFMDSIRKQVGSNMIGFNVSSSLTNFLAGVQAVAKTNKTACVKSLAQTTSSRIKSIFGKTDSFVENNPTIIRRKGADRFYRTPYQKVGDVGYVLMSAVDDVTTEFIVRAKYNEFIKKGMSEEKAITEADKWTSRLMGDRSLGQMPQIFNSKTLGMVTQFQLEVRNQLDSQFYDTIQEAKASNEDIQNELARNAKTAAKVTKTFFELAVLQHLFGTGFEAVAGYNPAFDIIGVLATALGYDDDEDSEDTALDNIEQGFLELLEDMPYSSIITNGGRIPISNALPIQELITGEDGYGNEKPRVDTVLETAPYYVLPGGYGQIKKTHQGLSMFNTDEEHPVAGSYTDSGNLRFPVEDTLGNRIQAAVFGQYANENAREYFDNGYAPLKEKQIQEYVDVDLPIADYWKYRKGLKGLETLNEKGDYIGGLDFPVDKKNILINNIADRSKPIDYTGYENYANFEEFDFATRFPEKYAVLQEQGISVEDYKKNYEETAFMYTDDYAWAANNPEQYTVSKAVTNDVVKYKQYTTELYNIKADKDANGKSISGSRKEKVIDYVNNLDLDYGEKLVLFKSEYPSDDTYNADIVDYLNNRTDLTYEELITIYTELGFTVKDGYVYWD